MLKGKGDKFQNLCHLYILTTTLSSIEGMYILKMNTSNVHSCLKSFHTLYMSIEEITSFYFFKLVCQRFIFSILLLSLELTMLHIWQTSACK